MMTTLKYWIDRLSVGDHRCCQCHTVKASLIHHTRPATRIREISECKTEEELQAELRANQAGPDAFFLISVCKTCYWKLNPGSRGRMRKPRTYRKYATSASPAAAASSSPPSTEASTPAAAAASSEPVNPPEPSEEDKAAMLEEHKRATEQRRIAMEIITRKRKAEEEEREVADSWVQALREQGIELTPTPPPTAEQKRRKKEEEGLDEWQLAVLEVDRADALLADQRASTAAAAAATNPPPPIDPRIPSFTPIRYR